MFSALGKNGACMLDFVNMVVCNVSFEVLCKCTEVQSGTGCLLILPAHGIVYKSPERFYGTGAT